MQVSALNDDYGFILAAPAGTREAGGNRLRFWNASAACGNLAGSGAQRQGQRRELGRAQRLRHNQRRHRRPRPRQPRYRRQAPDGRLSPCGSAELWTINGGGHVLSPPRSLPGWSSSG